MLIVSTLQMPAQQGRSNMRRLVEHVAGAIALAALMALLTPASLTSFTDHAMVSATAVANAGVALKPAVAATTDGRWKLGGDGSCYWDPDDSGPDQCSQASGRWKLGGDGSCYWDANDEGPNQCAPAADSPGIEVRAVLPGTALHARI